MNNVLKRGYVVHRQTNTRIGCAVAAPYGGDALGWYVIKEPQTANHTEHLLKLEDRMHSKGYMDSEESIGKASGARYLEIDKLLDARKVFIPRKRGHTSHAA